MDLPPARPVVRCEEEEVGSGPPGHPWDAAITQKIYAPNSFCSGTATAATAAATQAFNCYFTPPPTLSDRAVRANRAVLMAP